VAEAYENVAGMAGSTVTLRYEAPWREGGLTAALAAAQRDELRRGVTLVGPHRDELLLAIAGMPARSQASQGEQRSLALALRLGGHELVHRGTGQSPVLLLDDVFSELDPDRSQALVRRLPEGQALLTTAGALPAGIDAAMTVNVKAGQLL
jgi:DNA replication and repair protein RecF